MGMGGGREVFGQGGGASLSKRQSFQKFEKWCETMQIFLCKLETVNLQRHKFLDECVCVSKLEVST